MRELVYRIADRYREVMVSMKQKMCSHPAPYYYDEVRIAEGDHVSWHAAICCPNCDEIMSVEASFSGNIHRVSEAVDAEISESKLTSPDSIKMLRETLCVAQTRLRPEETADRARLGRLIHECDRQRPLGSDGKHGGV